MARTLGNFWTLESMETAVTMDSRVRHTRVGRTIEYTPHPGRTYYRVRHTRVGRTLEYATPG